jgi:hypothetical protein
MFQPLELRRIRVTDLFKSSLGIELQLLEFVRVHDDADTGFDPVHRDQPEPFIFASNHVSQRQVLGPDSDLFEMGEQNDLFEMRVALSEPELRSEQARSPKAIDYVPGAKRVSVNSRDGGSISIKANSFYSGLLLNGASGLGCMIEQDSIEERPLNLIGGRLNTSKNVVEKKFVRFIAGTRNDPSAPLDNNIGGINFLFHAHLFERTKTTGNFDSPILNRENFSFSRIKTFHPRFASNVPAVPPAGPPPITR